MVEDDIANQAAESVGINEITILAILGIILAGVLVRFLSMAFAPSLLKKIKSAALLEVDLQFC